MPNSRLWDPPLAVCSFCNVKLQEEVGDWNCTSTTSGPTATEIPASLRLSYGKRMATTRRFSPRVAPPKKRTLNSSVPCENSIWYLKRPQKINGSGVEYYRTGSPRILWRAVSKGIPSSETGPSRPCTPLSSGLGYSEAFGH
jgi:hypothetical protein